MDGTLLFLEITVHFKGVVQVDPKRLGVFRNIFKIGGNSNFLLKIINFSMKCLFA